MKHVPFTPENFIRWVEGVVDDPQPDDWMALKQWIEATEGDNMSVLNRWNSLFQIFQMVAGEGKERVRYDMTRFVGSVAQICSNPLLPGAQFFHVLLPPELQQRVFERMNRHIVWYRHTPVMLQIQRGLLVPKEDVEEPWQARCIYDIYRHRELGDDATITCHDAARWIGTPRAAGVTGPARKIVLLEKRG